MNNFSGSKAGDKTIQRLINRMARRIFLNGDLNTNTEQLSIGFPATQSSIPEYFRLELFLDRKEYHARLQSYINNTAIKVDWDSGSGDRGQLKRITLVNPKAAAKLLVIDLPWEVASKAIEKIKSVSKVGLPSIAHIIEAWKHGKSPCRVTPSNAIQFIDSLRVIEIAKHLGANNKDLLLRRVSAHMFGDSKRIEALERQIAFILDEPNSTQGYNVFASLGLVKHPQPMLLSGPSNCNIRLKEENIRLVSPYVGLSPNTIRGIEGEKSSIRCFMTIENLASFNEAAQSNSNSKELFLIYSAGNPTPSFLSAYYRLIKSSKATSILHWGDIDVGGFRIAARLAETANIAGFNLKLWNMNPMESASTQKTKIDNSKLDQIELICKKHGWKSEIKGLKKHPVFQEQEFIKWKPPMI